MANALYNNWKEALMDGSANADLSGNIKAVLVDTDDYTFAQTHDFLDDVPAGARVATSGNMASKTFTDGTFDVADFSFTSVTGDQSEALIFYVDTGSAATSRLIAYYDTATGLPITPDGNNIDVTINASGLFTL